MFLKKTLSRNANNKTVTQQWLKQNASLSECCAMNTTEWSKAVHKQ